MGSKTNPRIVQRKRRKFHVRKLVHGTPERPRLTVYRSLKHIYAQVIDDVSGRTLASAGTNEKGLREQCGGKKKREVAMMIGETIAERCLKNGIDKVIFDRNGFSYRRKTDKMAVEHLGRIESLAYGARKKEVDGKKLQF